MCKSKLAAVTSRQAVRGGTNVSDQAASRARIQLYICQYRQMACKDQALDALAKEGKLGYQGEEGHLCQGAKTAMAGKATVMFKGKVSLLFVLDRSLNQIIHPVLLTAPIAPPLSLC